MKCFFEKNTDYDDGLFGSWAILECQGSSLDKTGVKSVKGCGDACKKKDCEWLLNTH